MEEKTKPLFFTGKHNNHFIILNAYINQNCTATNQPSYVRIHNHKYKNLELFDQKKTKEIFDSRRRRNINKNTYKLFKEFLRIFSGDS